MHRQAQGPDDGGAEPEPGQNYSQKKLLAEVLDQVNGSEHSEEDLRSMFFYVSGFVAYMKNDDRSFYLACPECKRKVMEDACGWRCENCDKAHPNCIPTYMLMAKISDVSESLFCNFYRDEGTALMGLKAEKLRELKDQGDI